MRSTLALITCFFVGLLAGSCTLPNPEHCFNRAADPNAWCAEGYEDRPYCSPCAADNFGCVKAEPTADDCPYYTTPAPAETGTGETTGDETGTDTGTETG